MLFCEIYFAKREYIELSVATAYRQINIRICEYKYSAFKKKDEEVTTLRPFSLLAKGKLNFKD